MTVVAYGPVAEAEFDEAYAYERLPWLRANMIASLDGAATLEGTTAHLGNATDQRLLGCLRGLADVVLVGAGTVRIEGYGPLRPGPRRREARLAAGLAPVPPLAVVSRSLDLDLAAPVFADAEPGARTILLTCAAADPDRRARAAEVADVVLAGDERVDLAAAVDALAEQGLTRMLTEGGPILLAGLVAADRLDELCVTVSPLVTNGYARRITDGPHLLDAARLRLRHVLEEDGYLYLRYSR